MQLVRCNVDLVRLANAASSIIAYLFGIAAKHQREIRR